VLLDLMRVRGGDEHWRTCRGLDGEFSAAGLDVTARDGTIADPNGRRGDLDRLPHPDHGALTYLDDVQESVAPPAWRGYWESRIEPGVRLDLHQLRVSSGTELLAARATSISGTPEESDYDYRTLLWRKRSVSNDEPTVVDLLFEPRTGEPTVAKTATIPVASGAASASGVTIETRSGSRIAVYWAPDAGIDETTVFADGTVMTGTLAAVADGKPITVGVSAFNETELAGARQIGRISGLDRQRCTVDIEGLDTLRPGDRIRINPEGNGQNYAVTAREPIDGGLRVTLDMCSVHGRGPVRQISGNEIELGADLMVRTGFLHGRRLVVEGSGHSATILRAHHRGDDLTVVELEAVPEDLQPGEWVSAVDYVAGDPVLFERVWTGGA
jgi:hypothetical protein